MVKNATTSQENQHHVDLSKIEGDGSFPCPTCGTTISPEDESETAYTILETKVEKDELIALVVSCNKCKTIITLTGFQLTDE